jgi:hypothetical protein
MSFQGVEPSRPKLPVRRQPLVDLGQALGSKLVPAPLRVRAHPHQPGVTQHAQVLRDAGLAEAEGVDQLAYRA